MGGRLFSRHHGLPCLAGHLPDLFGGLLSFAGYGLKLASLRAFAAGILDIDGSIALNVGGWQRPAGCVLGLRAAFGNCFCRGPVFRFV